MQAQPGLPGAPTAEQLKGPLGQNLYSMPDIKHNFGVLEFNRIFISLVAGCLTGIAGVTGFKGFLVYLLGHALMGIALLVKAGFLPEKYFASWSVVAFNSVFSSTELLTFILAWTLSHNMTYLF